MMAKVKIVKFTETAHSLNLWMSTGCLWHQKVSNLWSFRFIFIFPNLYGISDKSVGLVIMFDNGFILQKLWAFSKLFVNP